MREARLIGGVNLADRAFNKKGPSVVIPANYQKPRFYRNFGEIPPEDRAGPRCADPRRYATFISIA